MNTFEDDDQIGALVGWLEKRVDTVADEAVAAIWAKVPTYPASSNPDLRREVRDHCLQVYSSFFDIMASGRVPDVSDFSWTRGHATRRADIPLADLLMAFRIGQQTMWDHVLAWTALESGSAEAALGVVSHLMQTIEVGSSVAAATYLEHARFRGADDVRLQRDLLEDLLAGRPPAVEARIALLAEANLAVDSAVLVAVGSTSAAPAGIPTLPDAAHLAGAALARDLGGLVVARQREVVGIFPADPFGEAEVARRVTKLVTSLTGRGIPIRVGISTVRTGLGEVPQGYVEAGLALETLSEDGGVRTLSSLSTLDYLVLRPDPSACGVIRPEIREFIAEDQAQDKVFVNTLREYVAADMNAKAAALALHIHVNTVYYRLERIAERTGCDLRRVDQVIDLYLAVRLLTEQV